MVNLTPADISDSAGAHPVDLMVGMPQRLRRSQTFSPLNAQPRAAESGCSRLSADHSARECRPMVTRCAAAGKCRSAPCGHRPTAPRAAATSSSRIYLAAQPDGMSIPTSPRWRPRHSIMRLPRSGAGPAKRAGCDLFVATTLRSQRGGQFRLQGGVPGPFRRTARAGFPDAIAATIRSLDQVPLLLGG